MNEEEIITQNRGLIQTAIREMNCKWTTADEYQEINDAAEIGLIRGAKTYNKEMGCKISGYLVSCIKNEIRNLFTYRTNLKRQAPGGIVVSLNKIIGEDEEDELINFIASEQNVEAETINKITNDEIIEKMLEPLKPKFKQLVIEHFGLYGNDPKTLGEIAKERHVSKSAIYASMDRALKHMRKVGKKWQDL